MIIVFASEFRIMISRFIFYYFLFFAILIVNFYSCLSVIVNLSCFLLLFKLYYRIISFN